MGKFLFWVMPMSPARFRLSIKDNMGRVGLKVEFGGATRLRGAAASAS
jgi:hypothetical protein